MQKGLVSNIDDTNESQKRFSRSRKDACKESSNHPQIGPFFKKIQEKRKKANNIG